MIKKTHIMSKKIIETAQDIILEAKADNILDTYLVVEDMRRDIKEGMQILDDFISENKEEIAIAFSDYPEGYKGKVLEVNNGRKVWSFRHISEWTELKNKMKEIEDRAKKAWELQYGCNLIISNDGEIMTPAEVSYSKGYIRLKDKK